MYQCAKFLSDITGISTCLKKKEAEELWHRDEN